MSDPAYDGLCGIPYPISIGGGIYLRCRYDLHHEGEHDWEKYRNAFQILGGIKRKEVLARARKGSPAARAMLGMPYDCSCVPCLGEDGNIADYVYDPACVAHAAK